MKHIQQTSSTCGQACVAMLAGITLKKSIELFGHSHSTCTKELVRVLRLLGFKTDTRLRKHYRHIEHKPEMFPRDCVMKVSFYNEFGVRQGHSHWVIMHKGKLYDPSDKDAELWWYPIESGKVTSTLKIRK